FRSGRPTAFVNGGLAISIRSSCARRSSRSFVLKPVPILPANTNSGSELLLDPVATARGSDTPSLTVGLLPRVSRLSLDPAAKLRTLTRPLPEGEEKAGSDTDENS